MRLFYIFSAGVLSLGTFLVAYSPGLKPEFVPQQGFSKVEIKTTKIAGTVYMLEGQGGNIGISAGPDGILMIDDQFAPLEPKIRAAIAAISKSPIQYLLNTHFHGDHTGGNEKFGAGATVIAHKNVRVRLAQNTGAKKATVKPGLPTITYDDGISIYYNDEEIRCIHAAKAHTDGDTVVYFTKSNVVHMGDLFFSGRFPFIDIRSGGSVGGVIEGCERVIRDLPADAKVIPGHGPAGTMDDLKQYVAFLKDAREIVKKAESEGKDLRKCQEDKILEKYQKFSWEFINTDTFIEFLFTDAQQNASGGQKKEK